MNTETKWQKERDAFAQGKRIQFKATMYDAWEDWGSENAPLFPNSWEWRIHPEDDQPAPFVPRFKVGDRVKLKGGYHKDDRPTTVVQVHGESVRLAEARGGTIGYVTWNQGDLEPYIWQLPAPPEGQSWHRTDWTEEMLPPGWRPLLKGEIPDIVTDEVYWPESERWTFDATPTPRSEQHLHTRTKRPLPLPEPAQQQEKCPSCGSDIPAIRLAAGCPHSWHSPSQETCPKCGETREQADARKEPKCFARFHDSPSPVEAREWPTEDQLVKIWCDYLNKCGIMGGITDRGRGAIGAVRQLMIDHAERMLAKEREAHKETNVMLQSLLARIHRDGGHYEAQHGRQKAVEDADEIVAHLNVMKDELAAERTARETAEKERDAARAQHKMAETEVRDVVKLNDSLRTQLAEAEKRDGEIHRLCGGDESGQHGVHGRLSCVQAVKKLKLHWETAEARGVKLHKELRQLSEASAQAQQGGWISVETRMPTKEDAYGEWETVEWASYEFRKSATWNAKYTSFVKEWDMLTKLAFHPTHWRHLPPLPAPQDEKEGERHRFEAWIKSRATDVFHGNFERAAKFPELYRNADLQLMWDGWLARGKQEKGGEA